MYVLIKEEILTDGSRVLNICGQEYVARADDHFIDKAIELAGYWEPYQVSYERVVHLADWIRRNEAHHVPMVDMQDMLACKEFVDHVISAEFYNLGGSDQQLFLTSMRENERIFWRDS